MIGISSRNQSCSDPVSEQLSKSKSLIAHAHYSACLSFAPCPCCFAYAMPCCPCCSKKCKTSTHLLQHMNHPSSKCIQFFEELIQISKASQTKPRPRQRSTLKCMGVRADGDIEMVSFNLPAGHDRDRDSPSIADDFLSDIPTQHSQFKDYYTEVYPGMARMYQRGPTFIDEFNGDEHTAM